MQPPGADRVLVRHGEIGTKSEQVRARMERQLRDNLAALLADRDVDASIEQRRMRLIVHAAAVDAACAAVTDGFGVVSASPTRRVEPTLPAIREALVAAAREHYDGGTFAIRARRAGERSAHPFTSRDIEEQGGDAVWSAAAAAGVDPAVDLDDPDLELFVECRPEDAFVFLEKVPGPGGLPLGTQAPLVALISGGIDSPVAAWEVMRRGSPVVPLYVDLGEYGGADNRARAAATVDQLARYAPDRDMLLRVAPAGEAVADIVETVDAGRMLVLRRFMLRVAEHVADETDAVGIVTGESIGQKSSQTSANLAATSTAVDLPVHRPLLGRNKTAITDRAERIGTFETSTIPAGCNRLAPTYPETSATPREVAALEFEDVADRAGSVAASVEPIEGRAAEPGGETA